MARLPRTPAFPTPRPACRHRSPAALQFQYRSMLLHKPAPIQRCMRLGLGSNALSISLNLLLIISRSFGYLLSFAYTMCGDTMDERPVDIPVLVTVQQMFCD